MRSIIDYFGLIAIGVSIVIILFFVGMIILAGVLTLWGGYDLSTNPHARQDTALEYQNATSQINNGIAGISSAVRNTTGG
jgi:nucleoside recognition membrane protein YjiH